MTQRPVNYSKKVCRKYRSSVEQHAPVSHVRRPTLYGIANREQLAIERSRVRLINQLTHPDNNSSRDFAAYFQSSQRNYPTYALTSHTYSVNQPKQTFIPTYPIVQSLRWNPYVETSSMEDLQSEVEDTPIKCTCENCSKKTCLAKVSSQNLKTGKFKNNIMTFADRTTMTPRLTEIGCGCNTVPCTRDSEVSVRASEIAVRDARAGMQINQFCSQKCPTPILKKNKPKQICDYYDDSINYQNHYNNDYDLPQTKYQEAEKDTRDDKLDRVSSMKSCLFKFCNNKKEVDNTRIIIYNEGISDLVANQYPVMPVSVPSRSNVRKNCSRVSIKSNRIMRHCVNDDNPIPYCHRSDSRYHQFCKSSESKIIYYDADLRHVAASPGRTCRQKGRPRSRTPPSKLPKRVLTSDRDIDSFVEHSYPKVAVPAAARKKIN